MDRKSSKDTRLEACAALHSCEEALSSATNVANNVLELLEKGDINKAKQMTKLIASTNTTASATIRKSRTKVNREQTAMQETARKSIEVHRKRQAREHLLKNKNKTNDNKVRVEAGKLRTFIEHNKENTKPAAKRKTTPSTTQPPKRVRLRPNIAVDVRRLRYHGPNLLPDDVDIESPPPPNDLSLYIYTPVEACTILACVEGEGKMAVKKTKVAIRKHWIAVGLVPVQYSTLQKHEATFNKGEAMLRDWDLKGRPRRTTVPDVEDMGQDLLNKKKGLTVKAKDVAKAIVQREKEKAAGEGIHPETKATTEPSKWTCQRIQHEIKRLIPEAVACDRAIAKSESRQIAETSLFSAVCFCLVVTTTSYRPCLPGEKPFELPEDATKGAKLGFEMAKRVFGQDVQCLYPQLITSTDDMNTFVFKGTVNDESGQMMLVSQEAYNNNNTRSLYSSAMTTKNKNGIRVKLNTTTTAAGQSAPPVIVVSGLSEAQLPKEMTPNGVLIMKVKNLGVGGTVTPDSNCSGFVAFIRSDGTSTPYVRRFVHQSKEVYETFIETIRRERFGFDRGVGEDFDDTIDVPSRLTAVSWNDGALDQVKANIICYDEWAKSKIVSCKQNPARTGTEQSEDLQPKYPIIRKECDCNSHFKDNPDLKCQIQIEVEAWFSKQKRDGKLIMKKSQQDAIVDFICTLPEVLGKALTCSNITKGYVQNGIIDETGRRCPDFFQMICGTTRCEIRKDVMDNIIEKFPELLVLQLAHGRVTDEELLAAGIPPDVNSAGVPCFRNYGITAESQQRAKQMNHHFSIQDRQVSMAAAQSKLVEKTNTEAANRNKILRINKECEQAIASAYSTRVKNDNRKNNTNLSPNLVSFQHAKIEDFVATAPRLKAFYHARHYDTTRWGGGKVPLKGDIEKAKEGEDNLIARAFACKDKSITLQPGVVSTQPLTVSLPTSASLLEQVEVVDSAKPTWETYRFTITVEWLTMAREAYQSIKPSETLDLPHLQKQSEGLLQCLYPRAMNHIQMSSDPDHWVWELFLSNLSRMCALMVYARLVHNNIHRFINRNNYGLLVDPSPDIHTKFVGDNNEQLNGGQWNGVYLVQDMRDIIRAGKASSGVYNRYDTHLKSSRNVKSDSLLLYRWYPSKRAEPEIAERRINYFEELQFYVALGYDPKSEHARHITDLVGGMFVYTRSAIQSIGGCNSIARVERQRLMMEYTKETALQLAIDPSKNISRSEGYEVFLKGNKKKKKEADEYDSFLAMI